MFGGFPVWHVPWNIEDMITATKGTEKLIGFVTLGAFFFAASTHMPEGVFFDRLAGSLWLLVDVVRVVLS